MIRFAALALSLSLTGAAYAADPPKPEPPKPEEKKPVDPEEAFKKMDKDKDGKLTLEEFKGKRTGEMATKAEARFKKMDKDSDGKVTLEEFKAGQPKKKA
jgi:Ca2+-binding EF-hand superfamily protein